MVMMTKPKVVGTVVLSKRKIEVVFSGCDRMPKSAREIVALVRSASVAAGASVIDAYSTKYPPPPGSAHTGYTGVAILGESHAVLATWPEHNAVEFSMSTCGEKADPAKAVDYLKEALQALQLNVEPGRESIATIYEK